MMTTSRYVFLGVCIALFVWIVGNELRESWCIAAGGCWQARTQATTGGDYTTYFRNTDFVANSSDRLEAFEFSALGPDLCMAEFSSVDPEGFDQFYRVIGTARTIRGRSHVAMGGCWSEFFLIGWLRYSLLVIFYVAGFGLFAKSLLEEKSAKGSRRISTNNFARRLRSAVFYFGVFCAALILLNSIASVLLSTFDVRIFVGPLIGSARLILLLFTLAIIWDGLLATLAGSSNSSFSNSAWHNFLKFSLITGMVATLYSAVIQPWLSAEIAGQSSGLITLLSWVWCIVISYGAVRYVKPTRANVFSNSSTPGGPG